VRPEDGLPRLIPAASPWQVKATVGQPFEARVAFQGIGGAGHGLRVEIRGSALERGLVEPRTVTLLPPLWPRMPATLGRRDATLVRGQSADGIVARHAEVADFRIPADAGPLAMPRRGKIDREAIRGYLDAEAATTFRVEVTGDAVDPGEGELIVEVTPLRHAGGGTIRGLRVSVGDA
jgi:hypothetical protein